MSTTTGERPCDEMWVCQLGTIPYLDAIALQQRICALRQANELPDTMLLLEHPPVYTRGRRAGASELLFGEDFYRSRGIDVVATDRGGRITYHGPGQLVGYPIMRIDAIDRHLRKMEAAIVAALADEGVEACARAEDGPDFTGVWVRERKIASIGVHVARGVSTHGFAVNVHNDLEPFSWVVACGLADVTMTSIQHETSADEPTDLTRFRARVADHFCRAHGRSQRRVPPQQLGVERRLGIDEQLGARAQPERVPA
jgi:lipoyl(octanoyl) transferase